MITNRLFAWKRFSLRTLFVLTTVCCLLFGTWAVYVNPYRLQADSLSAVNRLQGNAAQLPAHGPAWHRWLVTTLLGNEAFVRVTLVDLSGRKVDDEALRSLAGLVHLEELSLDYTPVTDDSIAVLRSMKNLRRLSLRYTKISDRGAAYLGTLPKIEKMILTGTKITDAAVDDLVRHAAISELYIRWTRISDAGADRLAAALPHCAIHHHALVPQP